jgi:hypothetical protein
MKLAGAALLVAALGRPALADTDLGKLDRSLRWEGAFGIRVGSFHVGEFDGSGFGVHLDGGVRVDRLLLMAEYGFMSISNEPDQPSGTAEATTAPLPASVLEGFVQRFGVDARYSVGKVASDEIPLRGDFWVEGGFGEQLVRWDRGGELHRPDLSLGFGGQFSGRFGHGHDHHAGIYYALKATFAHAPTAYANLPPTCAGPCDNATRPISIDRSFLFNLGIVFGN